jgi:carbonic anhydrase
MLSAFAMAALTAAFASPPSGQSENADAPAAPPRHWAYGGEDGPEHWGEMSADNRACSGGLQQSPIDLTSAIGAKVDVPHPAWIPAKGGMVVNNGHTIQVDLSDAGGMTLDGKEYSLKQFHFHHPSEHTIDGKQVPLELHLVHAAQDGSLAVVGILFTEGAANETLNDIWATAPAKEGKAAVAFQIDVSKFMPQGTEAFRYEGSLTTPPCSETVHWTVMAKPQTASAAQIAAFTQLFPWNARPVQPLNRRFVLKTSS